MLDFAVPFAIGLLSESDLIVPVVLPFCPAVWDLLLYSGLCPKEVAVPTAWEGSSSNGAWSGIDCASWRIFSSFIVGRSVLSLGPGLRWPPDLLFEVNTQTVNRVAQVGGWWGSGADLLGNLYFQIGLVILLPNSKFPPGGKRAAKVKLCEGKAEKEWNKRKIVSSLYLLNSSRAKGATSPGHPMYFVSLLTEAEWAGKLDSCFWSGATQKSSLVPPREGWHVHLHAHPFLVNESASWSHLMRLAEEGGPAVCWLFSSNLFLHSFTSGPRISRLCK